VSGANQITRRNRGHSVEDVIIELRKFANGWMGYFGISHTNSRACRWMSQSAGYRSAM